MKAKQLIESEYQPTEAEMAKMLAAQEAGYDREYIGPDYFIETAPDGTISYFRGIFPNCDLHREDGPAVINPNGSKEWYRNGVRYTEDGQQYYKWLWAQQGHPQG